VLALNPDGVFLSNGPGDPEPCDYAIAAIRVFLEKKLPTFGICLGHQLMALASGGKTMKMKFGHHGANHPVKDLDTGQVLITSQNHGFAADPTTLPANVKVTHVSLFDGSLQGMAWTDRPAFCFQGHPEASPGPHDVAYLFDRFIGMMENAAKRSKKRMPKRTDIHSILIIGAGPIIIGQACEFDYSGAQACKALREEGYRVILVNSNPATIMTDPGMADVTYIEPITWRCWKTSSPRSARRPAADHGRPDRAELRARSGQARRAGEIRRRDDRRLARGHRQGRGPREVQAGDDPDRPRFGALRHRPQPWKKRSRCRPAMGFPTIIRPSFTMGGSGGGIAYNQEEFVEICKRGLEASPTKELLIEESLLGWKEYEMEVVRDRKDNCIIICSIENLDPMGVHTGDSITVAPAQTLTDKEYQIMRNASIAVLREIGVDTGGSNVQFAINPDDGRMIVIEMNPRVSRSSALASKATGFPIAKVAAKLAVGYTLDELKNDITGGATPASFEPSIDYVVTKVPRFAFEKFPQANDRLTTQMKSVGEVMAIGRTFQESMQKALRGLESASTASTRSMPTRGNQPRTGQRRAAAHLVRGPGLPRGLQPEQVFDLTKIDPWFLVQIEDIVTVELDALAESGDLDADALRGLKRKGFSDRRIGTLGAARCQRRNGGARAAPCPRRAPGLQARGYLCRRVRHGDGLHVFHLRGRVRVAADQAQEDHGARRRSQPHRPGHRIRLLLRACRAGDARGRLRDHHGQLQSGNRVDRLRHLRSPLFRAGDAGRHARNRPCRKAVGVIVQFGGQTPLKRARELEANGVPIIGTSPDMIDAAEDRERFQKLLHDLGLKQPPNRTARTEPDAIRLAAEIGYPLVVRPSYVLGGRAMEIVHEQKDLERYMREAVKVSFDSPVLLDRFLNDATEVDVDALSDGKQVLIGGIMEHIEQAGVHSGDSACSLPPFSLSAEIQDELRRQTEMMARGLNVVGLMNVQFAIQGRGDGRGLCAGSQSARLAHRALRLQGHQPAAGQDRRALHGRPQPGRPGRDARSDPALFLGEGSGIPLRQVSRRRYHPRPGNEVHRRGDGRRPQLRRSLRQVAVRRRHAPAEVRQGLPQRQAGRPAQGGRGRARTA
jgi:carbamoyl-phosphate synthase large subunit